MSIIKDVLFWITFDHNIAKYFIKTWKIASDRVISRPKEFHLPVLAYINLSNKKIISMMNSVIVLKRLISLVDINNGVLWKVLRKVNQIHRAVA